MSPSPNPAGPLRRIVEDDGYNDGDARPVKLRCGHTVDTRTRSKAARCIECHSGRNLGGRPRLAPHKKRTHPVHAWFNDGEMGAIVEARRGKEPPGATVRRLVFENDEDDEDPIHQLEADVGTLFEAIEHGDAEHRAWLKGAIEDHFAGRPVQRQSSGEA